MGPSPSARLFAARLRLYIDLRRAVRGFDVSDLLTVAAFACLGLGIVIVAGPGWALVFVGSLLALMTPIGAALRLFIRGR